MPLLLREPPETIPCSAELSIPFVLNYNYGAGLSADCFGGIDVYRGHSDAPVAFPGASTSPFRASEVQITRGTTRLWLTRSPPMSVAPSLPNIPSNSTPTLDQYQA